MNRVLTILAFVTFSGALFQRCVDPIIVEIATGFRIEPSTAALLSTAYAVPFALVQPILGALADMFSKPRLMLICLALLSGATLAGAVAKDFDLLVVTRMIAGVGSGGLIPIAFAFVGDLVPADKRQVALGRLLFAIMSGNLLGASCAGVLADLLGWRSVFVAMAVLGIAVFVIAAIGLRNIKGISRGFDLRQMWPNYRSVFANPMAKYCLIAVSIEGVFMYGIFPHMASLLANGRDSSASIAGLVIAGFGVGGAIYGLRVSWLLKRLGETWMMRIGGSIMGICIALIALRLPWPAEVANFMALGLGFYMLHGVLQVYNGELSPAARGSAMALHSFFFFLGLAIGPVVYKYSFAHGGETAVLLAGGLVLALNGQMCAHFLRRPVAV